MLKANIFRPIFYMRGFTEPYTEGHIKVIKNMIEALLCQNISSVIFNYRYDSKYVENRIGRLNVKRFEHYIPLIDREEIFHGRKKSIVALSSLMETLATLKFLLIEKRIRCEDACYVVNVVNCFTYPRILAKQLFSSPIVLHFYMRNNMSYENMTNILVDTCDMIISSSNEMAYFIKKKYNVSSKKVEVIYPPVDTTVFTPVDKSNARSMLGLSNEAKIILYIGGLKPSRFPENKVLPMIKNIMKENFETRLLIFTPNTTTNITRMLEILAKAKSLDLTSNVKITVKNLSDEEKNIIYNASDIFLFPSLDSTLAIEPPLTVIESMASGLPVVSNDISSVKEIITTETDGLVESFKNKTSSNLEEKISSLIMDRDLLKNLSYNARIKVMEKASFLTTGGKLVNVFRNICSY